MTLLGAGAGRKPLFIELFAGLHGWGEGAVKEGFFVVGFDIVDMCKEIGIERPEGCNLVLQDVTTLHGSQFKDAAVIVASPPCQGYSYRAMPWKRAKAFPPPDNTLFETCFRIQREACEATWPGRHIPLIVENVKGAQPWVGGARAHFGSFYLWGDVPALMPQVSAARKNNGGSWYAVAPHNRETTQNPDGRPGTKNGNDWFGAGKDCSLQRRASSKSPKRKAASAIIAKIPFPLSSHIARCFLPPPAGMEEGT